MSLQTLFYQKAMNLFLVALRL